MFQRHDAKDYYAILQVDPQAEPEVIEAAYRRLALKHHPDVSGKADAGRRMQELNEAFEVLGDPTRRRVYDRQRALGSGPATLRPISLQTAVKALLPYLGLALLVVLSIRILPLLLRPPVLAALVVAACVYLLLRRLR